MTFLLHTDLGHDPDDAIAIAYLIEHSVYPRIVGITPGYGQQADILNGILSCYSDIRPVCYHSKSITREKELAYNPAKHNLFIKAAKYSNSFCPYSSNIAVDKALIIGPPLSLGNILECEEMYFQGGYSPNSINPLEKFNGVTEIQSFNPSGARKDFKKLLESKKIKKKYYIGKNVCHGFTKDHLKTYWEPKHSKVKEFWDLLEGSKAMHDVLAAMISIDKDIGIWEQAKPVFNGLKMSTQPTDEEIYTLIGVKW